MSAAAATSSTPTTTTMAKALAGSVSSSDDVVASAFNVSPAASVNGDVAASVDSGSFGVTRQASLVTDSPSGSESLAASTRTDNVPAPAQRSQRLLVRVPSTGAVVVVPASALAFGRHKQRGKPLVLCPGFDGAQDAATAVCPDPANCRHVHADLKLSTPFHPHRRSAALLGQYPRMQAGTIEAVRSADGVGVEQIPAERMLLTRALEGTRRPIPQCEHFLKSACNRGSECDFAHVVGGTTARPPQHPQPEPKPKAAAAVVVPRANKQAPVQLSQPLLPPQAFRPYPHRYDRGPCPPPPPPPPPQQQQPCRVASVGGHSGGHAMPHWSPSSIPMPSAATVLSHTWAAPSAPSAAAVLRH